MENNLFKIDNSGKCILTKDGFVEYLLHNGADNLNVSVDFDTDDIISYFWKKNEDIVFTEDTEFKWFYPKSYDDLDLYEYFLPKCQNKEETERMTLELELYKQKDLERLLRCMIWLVDFMTEHKIVWGVGRGSSCASWCLYACGLHMVNPVKYNIDCNEFFKHKEQEDAQVV